MNEKVLTLLGLIGVSIGGAIIKTYQEAIEKYKRALDRALYCIIVEFAIILILLEYIWLKK